MKNYSINELRSMFLKFFESKGCLCMNSFPLVPQGDNSLLLINAGMAPLKRYFTGELTPPRKRVTTCQKCVRTLDIDNVGKTARHGTFFEMLGNFSFGDYFKEDAIPWAWEFLTKVLGIPEERLYVTIYLDDDEAREIWLKTGVPDSHIFRLGKEDNFWEIGAGPCGPCSEIHFDRGPKYGDCTPEHHFGEGCGCDRFIEVWNIVFTQFDGDGKGGYTRLAHPNIDTGMGLERLACVMQDVGNLFEVDTNRKILDRACAIANTKYDGGPEPKDVSIRVITDHIRTATFLISDGVIPSNEGRGYILRRVLRRAARHGRLLGIDHPFLSDLCETVINVNCDAYPELTDKRDYIKKTIDIEEERFYQTLDAGLNILEKTLADCKDTLAGDDAFKLYDTYGFPIDLTKEIALERGIKVDEARFTELMKEQKQRARDARLAMGDVSWSDDTLSAIDKANKTEFVGYKSLTADCTIKQIIFDGEAASTVSGGNAIIVLDKTPFYAEMGGQVGDKGVISTATGKFSVTDTKKTPDGQYIHFGTVIEGELTLGAANAAVDTERRAAIMRNHSALHLLQSALRKVLGSHVEQAGSYVDEAIGRFDFTHQTALTKEEIAEVETLVNEYALAGADITCTEMPIEEAKKTGAIALFGEKYGSVVRVVKMGDYSTEFCGGTHLDNTAKMGMFKIVSESSVAAGVRRIVCLTGLNTKKYLERQDEIVFAAKAALKATDDDLAGHIGNIQNELKNVKKDLANANLALAQGSIASKLADAPVIGGVKLLALELKGATADAIRAAADNVKAEHADTVCVFACESEGKAMLAAACGAEAIKKGAHAGNLLKAISSKVQGGGGGRPDSATSGGKNPAGIPDALAEAANVLKTLIK